MIQERREAKKILMSYKFGTEREKDVVLRTIEDIDDVRQRNILTMRYIWSYSWSRCIYEWMQLGYAERTTYGVHSTALEVFLSKYRNLS